MIKSIKEKGALSSLLLTVFIDLLGIGIVAPVGAALFLRPESAFNHMYSQRTLELLYGLLAASYPFGSFFGAPILGDLSDRYGRKMILVLSLTGTLIGYLLIILGVMKANLWVLFAARLIDGFTGGNISVANSAIADLSRPEDKPRNFGLIGMAFGLGFIIGPFVGGVLSDPVIHPSFTYATPFVFAALLTFINIISVIKFLPETLKIRGNASLNLLTGFRNIKRAMVFTNIRTLMIVIFLVTLGFNFFTQFFQVYLIEKFNFTTSQIGYLFAFSGFCIALVQGLVVKPVSNRIKPSNVLKITLILLAVTFPLLTIPKDPGLLYVFVPFMALFTGLSQPNATTLVSNLTSSDAQGEILGIQQSIQSLALIVPPIIAGYVIRINIDLPLLTAGFVTFVAWIVYLLFFYKKHSQGKSEKIFLDH